MVHFAAIPGLLENDSCSLLPLITAPLINAWHDSKGTDQRPPAHLLAKILGFEKYVVMRTRIPGIVTFAQGFRPPHFRVAARGYHEIAHRCVSSFTVCYSRAHAFG
jgi:hypothetical protein